MPKPHKLHHPKAGSEHGGQVEDRGQRGEGALRDIDPDSQDRAVHICRGSLSSGASMLQHKVHSEEYISQVSVFLNFQSFSNDPSFVHFCLGSWYMILMTTTFHLQLSHSNCQPLVPAIMENILTLIECGREIERHYCSINKIELSNIKYYLII